MAEFSDKTMYSVAEFIHGKCVCILAHTSYCQMLGRLCAILGLEHFVHVSKRGLVEGKMIGWEIHNVVGLTVS